MRKYSEMRMLNFFICVVMCAILMACDSGLRVVGIEINTYPDKLFYVIGIDSELEISGGSVTFINRDNRNRDRSGERGQSLERFGSVRIHGTDFTTIVHEIDFLAEGVYTVKLLWPPDFQTTFPVQVISIETLKYRVGLI